MSRTLTNIHDVVEVFGGHAELARWAGYEHASGVANWLSRGIPPGYHTRLSLELKRRGFVLDPDLLGLEAHDAEMYRAVFEPDEPQPEAAA